MEPAATMATITMARMTISTYTPSMTEDTMMPAREKFWLRRSPSRLALLKAMMLKISPTRLATNANTNPRMDSTLSELCGGCAVYP